MKKQTVFGFLFVFALLSACRLDRQVETVRGSGTVVSETREITGVRGVTLATLGDLTIVLGDREALIVEAEDNLLPHLETVVRGGTLTIGSKPGSSLLPTKDIHYQLTVRNLDKLSVTSSGNMDAPALEAADLTIDSSSSGDIHLAGLTADNLDVEISSSGDIVIDEGQVTRQDVTIRSSGNYMAEGVRCERAAVEISSSGNATIWATDRLNARLTSTGNVNYYGGAAVEQSISSGGSVVSLGER